MKKTFYSVVVTYSFCSEVRVALFENLSAAKKYLREDFMRECLIDAENNNIMSITSTCSENEEYASITNSFEDAHRDVTEWVLTTAEVEDTPVEVNTRIEYQYRDRENNKSHNHEVIKGEITEKQVERILCCLQDGEHFIPAVVGFSAERSYDWDDEIDHDYFELCKEDFVSTDEKPTVNLTAGELVDRFEWAAGRWDKLYLNQGRMIETQNPTLYERDKKLEKMWDEFADVPMDPETEKMEAPFYHFPAGTDRLDIWAWFDERYSKGVAHLLYGDGVARPDYLATLAYRNALCFECEADCIFNPEGVCKYPLFNGVVPDYLNENGCPSCVPKDE